VENLRRGLKIHYSTETVRRLNKFKEVAKYADMACKEAVKARSILGIYTSCGLAVELHKSTDPEDP